VALTWLLGKITTTQTKQASALSKVPESYSHSNLFKNTPASEPSWYGRELKWSTDRRQNPGNGWSNNANAHFKYNEQIDHSSEPLTFE